ncbi:hypothetical protein ACS0TY_031611 [Phlomoides rotata]
MGAPLPSKEADLFKLIVRDIHYRFLFHSQQCHYYTYFKVPDVYDVFQCKVEYQRLRYTILSLSKQDLCVLQTG